MNMIFLFWLFVTRSMRRTLVHHHVLFRRTLEEAVKRRRKLGFDIMKNKESNQDRSRGEELRKGLESK